VLWDDKTDHLKGKAAMNFEAKELIFAIDVATDDHDIVYFEFYEDKKGVRFRAITCGKTNPPGKLPTFEAKEFAVSIKNDDDLQSLRNALTGILKSLDQAKLGATTFTREDSAGEATEDKVSGEKDRAR